MRRFRFSLETVLKVKRQIEELRERELAQARRLRDQSLADLARLHEAVKEGAEARAMSRHGRLNLAEEQWYSARLNGLRGAIQGTQAQLKEREALCEEARLKAVEAARERSALEKLEEGQYQQHLIGLRREEQGLMDELAQRSHSVLAAATP